MRQQIGPARPIGNENPGDALEPSCKPRPAKVPPPVPDAIRRDARQLALPLDAAAPEAVP